MSRTVAVYTIVAHLLRPDDRIILNGIRMCVLDTDVVAVPNYVVVEARSMAGSGAIYTQRVRYYDDVSVIVPEVWVDDDFKHKVRLVEVSR